MTLQHFELVVIGRRLGEQRQPALSAQQHHGRLRPVASRQFPLPDLEATTGESHCDCRRPALLLIA